MRVLLVDDNPLDRTRVAETLRTAWPQLFIAEANNADEWNAALPELWDALITAQTNCWAEASVLLQTMRAAHPFAALFVLGETEDWQSAFTLLKVGADDYLPKAQLPQLPDALQTCLTRLMTRKLAEDSLREKEERLRMALTAAHMSSWEWTPRDDVIRAAPMFEEMLQGRPATRESYLSVMHPDDREQVRALTDSAVREGKEYRQEFRFLNEAGQVIWVASIGRPFYDEQGQCGRLIGVVQEIGERKRAEAALKEQQARLRLALEAAAMTDWEWRMSDDAIIASSSHESLMGARPVTREDFQLLVHPADRDRIRQAGDRAITHQTDFLGEFRVVQPDGQVRWYFSHGRPLVNATGIVERLIGVTYEITDRKEKEEMLRESRDRLQTLSRRLIDAQETERRRIARELHDETGQALTAVKLNLQSLKRKTGDAGLNERLDDSIKIVEDSLRNIRNLSHDLRPTILDDLGLIAALRWYVDRQSRRAGFTSHFRAQMREERLPTEIETACFRIVQEALTNIIRHAAAHQVWVELRRTPQEFRLVVRDDGIGFNVRAAHDFAMQGNSLGILGMQERAQLAGGQCEIKSGRKGGVEITVRFGLEALTVLGGLANPAEENERSRVARGETA